MPANQAPVIAAGTPTYTVTRVSTDAAGTQGNDDSANPVFSPDGGKVAFVSVGSNLFADDTNNIYDVFVKNLVTGAITQVSEIRSRRTARWSGGGGSSALRRSCRRSGSAPSRQIARPWRRTRCT